MHGFFVQEVTLGYRILWPLTLLAIGGTAACLLALAGWMLSGPNHLRRWLVFSLGTFLAYAVVVVAVTNRFWVAIAYYGPAMMALLIASMRAYCHTRLRAHLWLSIGIVISALAAFLQQKGVALHPTYFNHNSTYHLAQAIALWIMFRAARELLDCERLSS